MTFSSLPPDDLPTPRGLDDQLLWEFDEIISRNFYEACDISVQKTLDACGWRLTSQANALTLNILCPTKGKNWHILRYLSSICFYLSKFSNQAQICIYPPPTSGTVWKVRVTEGMSFV